MEDKQPALIEPVVMRRKLMKKIYQKITCLFFDGFMITGSCEETVYKR